MRLRIMLSPICVLSLMTIGCELKKALVVLITRAGGRTPRTPRPGGPRVAQGLHVTYGKKFFVVF